MTDPATPLDEAIFEAARACPDDVSRQACLDSLCGPDQCLRERVEALLRAQAEAERFFGVDPVKLAHGINDGDAFQPMGAMADPLGQRIGPYVLREKLGEGGCGIVYVAEQEAPVRRQVALKLIKPGMDSRTVVARFTAERQALARMDHPHVAHIYDAGTTDSGRLYFVMELIRGVRITTYCDQAQLGTRERIELFIKVCQAVQHAHQKGVIHRDLKPSNILVAVHEGAPDPKVIDFGIAKATEGRLTELTLHTELHHFLGTPAYMSPEQAEHREADVDTRTDIYSLGVLLYELLTGHTPFDTHALLQGGIEEIRRTIREVEPLRPSTRLSTLTQADQDILARARGIEPPRLRAEVLGDLDWIVMKCLEKDRTRRYETANGLAADLKRSLANEPVLARPPSAGYRFKKAFRRNRAAMLAGMSVALAILVGLAGSTWMYFREARAHRSAQAAEEQQARARREADRQRAAAEHLLAHNQVDAGWAHWTSGDYWGAMAAFLEALRLDSGNPQRERIHRLRLAAVQQGQPRLLRSWSAGQPVTSAVFPKRQRRVLIATQDAEGRAEACVWDFDAAQPGTAPMPHAAAIRAMDFSDDGRRVLTASDDGTARVWDSATGRPITEPLRLGVAASIARFSPDGAKVLAGCSSGREYREGVLAMWNARTGELLWREAVEGWNLRSVAFSPDSTWVACGSFSYRGLLIAVESHEVRPLPNCWRLVDCAFSLDGRRLVMTGAFGGDGALVGTRILDVEKGDYCAPLFSHQSTVTSACFSPDGMSVATGGQDHMVQVWNAVTGQPVTVRLTHSGVATAPQFSSDGRSLLAIGSDHTVGVWQIGASHPLTLPLPHPGELRAAHFAPDTTEVWTVSADGSVNAWSTRPTMTPPRECFRDQPLLTAAIGASNLLYAADSSGVSTFRMATGEFVEKVSVPLDPSNLRLVTFPDELVLRSGPELVHINTTTGAWHNEPRLNGFDRVLLEGTRRILFAAHGTFDVQELDATGELVHHFDNPGFLIHSAVMTPDRTRMIGLGLRREVVVWNADSGDLQELGNLGGSDGPILRSEFSADGRHLLVMRLEGLAEVYDAAQLASAAKPKMSFASVRCAAFSPDGRLLVTAGEDGYTHIYDTTNGGVNPIVIQRQGLVDHVGFSDDGTLIFTGSNDRTARVWDTATGQPVTPALLHGGGVSSLVFDPGEGMLWTTCVDGGLRGWRLPSETRPADELRARIGDATNLSAWDRAESWKKLRATLPASR